MRTELLAYLTANLTATIKPSNELPFLEGNIPLYNKNLRRVYLDEPNTEQDRLFGVLGAIGDNVYQKITTVRGFLSVDAKTRNADLDTALTTLGSAKDVATITAAFRREFDYTTTITDGVITYEMQWRFYSIT